MEALIRFYDERIAQHRATLEALKRKIYHAGTLRLLIVVAALVAVWIARGAGWGVLAGIGAVCAVPFVALMVYHNRLSARKDFAAELMRLNEAERRAIDYDFSAFDGGGAYADAAHPFALDLDVFGEQSLFRSLNCTVTSAGQSLLAQWFMRPLTERAAVLRRREAIRELADRPDFRQPFYATGIASKGQRVGASDAWMKGLPRFADRAVWRVLKVLVPALWIVVAAGCAVGAFPTWAAGGMLAVSFGVANLPARRIHALCKSADRMEGVLKSYAALIARVEAETFRAESLVALRRRFVPAEGVTASQAIRGLSRLIGALDQRYSMAGLLLNLFLLRDVWLAARVERWMAHHAVHAADWFEALAEVDALCSLGGFAFNHPDYPYPELTDAYFCMEGRGLGHPLIHRDRCVRNDLHIARPPHFVVITGANMAGKSTYLRTVGVNFLLACMGLPVCAEQLTVSPAPLFTSLRTADSLAAGESYFFAELKRLKQIIDRLQSGEQLFIILDEILKGTNSEDKRKGSLALMKQLVGRGACGIIATHDLQLGALADEFPESVENGCFEADMTADTLTFSYRLRPGMAQNMNACFLMKRMGIIMGS